MAIASPFRTSGSTPAPIPKGTGDATVDLSAVGTGLKDLGSKAWDFGQQTTDLPGLGPTKNLAIAGGLAGTAGLLYFLLRRNDKEEPDNEIPPRLVYIQR